MSDIDRDLRGYKEPCHLSGGAGGNDAKSMGGDGEMEGRTVDGWAGGLEQGWRLDSDGKRFETFSLSCNGRLSSTLWSGLKGDARAGFFDNSFVQTVASHDLIGEGLALTQGQLGSMEAGEFGFGWRERCRHDGTVVMKCVLCGSG